MIVLKVDANKAIFSTAFKYFEIDANTTRLYNYFKDKYQGTDSFTLNSMIESDLYEKSIGNLDFLPQ